MKNYFVYLAVIVSGGSVLAVELLGTRIIAPFYGSSLYLWSALISITLAALSVGYMLGGRWADRGVKLERFCAIIGLAGLWIILIPWLLTPALSLTEALGIRTAVLVTATVLFFPPLALLGMVSPYAIKLKVTGLDDVGRTAGDLYAISTVASVVAALATGFFLIPNVGVSRLIFVIGLSLIATATIGILTHNRKFAAPSALVLLAVVAAGVFFSPSRQPDPKIGLLAIEQSEYAEIRVVDYRDSRFMLIDGGTHTIVSPGTWESHFPYVNVLDIAKGFFDRPGEALLIGLGGGSVVKSFVRDGWKIDAVEIDPVVTQMAYEFFGLEKSEARVYEMDGREFLIRNSKKYDLIIMDAFGSSSIPFHLVTTEAFGLIRSRLNAAGVFAMNIEAVGWDDIIVRSLAATVNQQFRHTLVLPIAEPPDQLGNLIILASDDSLTLENDPPTPDYRFSAEYDRAHAWDNRFIVDTTVVQILTDELNPIDIWAERVNLVARRNLHKYFEKKGLAW